jgi:hypothetical protein
MIPQGNAGSHPVGCTLEEFRRLLAIRRETLDIACKRGRSGHSLPIPWRIGWKASLSILGRDRDGSLRAVVFVTGPHASDAMTRRVRLVRAERLIY